MATAEELLATVGNEENYIVIDSDLRTMTFPASIKNIGVENDKDVHKLNFMMPRYFSKYDLSTFNIQINYLNAQGDGDMYVVTDPTVEDDTIYFSWLVGRHACLYRGAVTFIVCLKLADGEGDVAQEYNTTLASLQVLPGLETEPTILENDYDIIEQLLLTIQDTNDKIKAVLDSGMTAEELGNIAKEQKTLKSRMDEFASLPDGSTAGDAELTDIRVGADGTQYKTAGEAVRTQITDLKSDMAPVITNLVTSGLQVPYAFSLKTGNAYKFKNIASSGTVSCYFSVDGTINGQLAFSGLNPGNEIFVIPDADYNYIRVYRGAADEQIQLRASGGDFIDALKGASVLGGNVYDTLGNAIRRQITEAIDYTNDRMDALKPMINSIITTGLKVPYAFQMETGKTYRFTNVGVSGVVSCYGSVDGVTNGTLLVNGLQAGSEKYVISDNDYSYIRVYRGAADEQIQIYVCGGEILECLSRKSEITVGQNANYTSLLSALKNCDEFDVIHVLRGDYDIVQEYEDFYGASFWDDYTGYASTTDKFYRGLWLKNGVKLIFDSNARVSFNYTGSNAAVRGNFAPIATCGNCEINGLNLSFSGCRYAVHDDFFEVEGTEVFKNCIFTGQSNNGDTIGAGLGRSNLILIENCLFVGNASTSGGDISYHNNGYASNSRSKVIVKDCCGENTVKFKWYGTNTEVSECIACGNKFKSIECVPHTVTPNETVNMHLTKWNNIETA